MMDLSFKEIRLQAKELSKAKGGKGEKVLTRRKMQELNREIAMHTRRKDEIAKILKERVLKIKDPILKNGLKTMRQTFERMLDKKDYHIEFTMKLMTIADDQLQYTVEYYCDAMDKLINNYFCKLNTLAKENRKRFDKCIKSAKDFIENISFNQDMAETHMQLQIFVANSKSEYQKTTQRSIHLMKEEKRCKSFARKREHLRQYLEYKFLDMWDEYISVFKSYVNNTAEIKKEVRRMREKDNILRDTIAAQAFRLQQSEGLTRRLRSELLALESVHRIELCDRLNKHREACKRLKIVLSEDSKLDDKHIMVLVSETSGAIDWLECACKKGEMILKLAAFCRKFETQREKVLPFANTPSHDSTHELGASNDYPLMRKTLKKNGGLARLWQKISNAKLSHKALLREKLWLEYENKILTRKVQGTGIDTIANKCVRAQQKASWQL